MKTNRERSESDYVGPRKIVLCGKVSESLSEQVRQLVAVFAR